jgi:glycosyltransferase involved in cell wall biosynthesis
MSVTVAIACYNHGHFLAEAIESALTQSSPPDEIIVVDDGSTDNTSDVATRYPQALYVKKPNGGLSSARNAALFRASGERILFLDADDILLPNAVQDSLAAFAAEPEAAFVYGGYREVDASRKLLFEHMSERQADPFEALLRGNYIAMHGTVMYDTAILRDSGGFDIGLKSCEDYDVYLRLARANTVGCYFSIGADYRRHGGNMTANHIQMIRYARAVIKRHGSSRSLPARYRTASRAGLEFMTSYYAEAALKEIKAMLKGGRFPDALHRLMDGLGADPRFALRIAKAMFRRLRARLTGPFQSLGQISIRFFPK